VCSVVQEDVARVLGRSGEVARVLGRSGGCCPRARSFKRVCAFVFGLIRTHARSEDVRSVQISLPKTGEGSGGVDVREQLFDWI